MNQKFTSTIAGASIFITIFTLFGKGLGFLREIIFAAFFGLSQNFEVYLVATVIPIVINTIIIVLGQNYFIPNYYRSSNKINRTNFFNQSLSLFIFISLIISLLLLIFSNQIIDFYLGSESISAKNTAVTIFNLFLISIPLSSVISVLIAFLQSEKNFTLPIISNLLVNIIIIFIVPFFSNKLGIFIIPISYLLGITLQVIYLFLKVRGKVEIKFSLDFLTSGWNANLGLFLFFTIVIESISQMFVLVDRYFLDEVQKGGIAALNYSLTLWQLPIVILPAAISTVLFPSFSEMIRLNQVPEISEKLNKAISTIIFLTIPMFFIFTFFGGSIIKILFQRGNFSSTDSLITFNTLKMYSISLVFYAVYTIMNKLFYSAGLLKQLLLIMGIGVSLKIILNIFLVNEMFQDGLALSTSICFIFYCLFTLAYIKKIKINSFFYFTKNLLFYLINGLICLLISTLVGNILLIGGNVSIVNIFQILFFISFFLINCYLIHDKSLAVFIGTIAEMKKSILRSKFYKSDG